MPRLGRATGEQVPPRGAGGDERGVLPVLGRLVLGQRHQRISQTHSAHVMRLRGLHDLDKRLVETAAPQRDEHTFRSVEDPRPRPARILRPTRCVQLALTSCCSATPITHHITYGRKHIFPVPRRRHLKVTVFSARRPLLLAKAISAGTRVTPMATAMATVAARDRGAGRLTNYGTVGFWTSGSQARADPFPSARRICRD